MLSILLIGVGLSMDAFAVSVTSGLTVKGFGPKHAALLGLYFGGFQFLMPLIGYLLGSTVSCVLFVCSTFVLCFLGGLVGGKIPGVSCKTAGIAGGVVLCGIGIKLLIEGLVG